MFKKLFNFGKNKKEEVKEEVENVNEDSIEEGTLEEEQEVEETPQVEESVEIEEPVEELKQEAATQELELEDEIQEDVDETCNLQEETVQEVEEAEIVEEQPKKVSLFDRLKQGLTKAKQGITDRVDEVLKSYTKVDEELLEDLEEVLITADVGVNTTMEIMEKLEDAIRSKKITDPQDVREELKSIVEEILSKDDTKLDVSHSPTIILMVGVNGVGKTTKIGRAHV